MGNWRTVRITGSCAKHDISALKKAITYRADNFHCLTSVGIFGLRNWALESIDEVGSLVERDYSELDVASQLEKLAAIAPSLSVDVHVGGEYEDVKCIATVVVRNKHVSIVSPRVVNVAEKDWQLNRISKYTNA